VEGILKIVGVRWTLSDSVVGYRYFEVDTKKKRKAKKGDRISSGRNLILIVIKVCILIFFYVR
jgi:trafficking protein particle complex subunit 8